MFCGSVLFGLVCCFTMRIVLYAVLGVFGVFGVLLIYSICVGRSELLGYFSNGYSGAVEFMICHKYVATCDLRL